MLFRADFVHQRHVPGTIESCLGSLSKIVGHCWRALPRGEKRIREVRAEHVKVGTGKCTPTTASALCTTITRKGNQKITSLPKTRSVVKTLQEEEEENIATPPGSPVPSLLTLSIPTIGSRHPSPVRHEGRIGVTLCGDGPVVPVSPARSEV
ncbi:hypothetical protein BJY52DRAFT_1251201 [Lactarius psammicola]|nr:hypothetical protein BJY52DRAFT_1251201 [Lactarius psammicola]